MPNPRDIIRLEGVDRQFHRTKILAVLLIPLFVSMLAVSAINVALPTIELGLGATTSDVQWLLSGYALAFGLLLIPAGRLGDVLGRGQLFVVGVALFTFASLMSGFAQSPFELNAWRIVQGAGAGIFSPQTVGMIQQYYRGAGRAKAFALFGMAVSVSVAVGPVMSGWIIQAFGPQLGWRASFIVNVPIGLAGIVLALLWFPFDTERRLRASRAERRGGNKGSEHAKTRLEFDPVGALLVVAGVLAIMWPFIAHSPNLLVWLLLPAGGALLAVWVAWERRYAARGREPMVDVALFRFPSFSYGTAMTTFLFLGVTSVFACVAILLQSGLHETALAAGMIGLPNATVSVWSSWWAGKHTMTHGHRIIVFGLVSVIVGTAMTAVLVWLTFHHGLSFWWMSLTLALNGFGMGAIGSANQTLTLEDVPHAQGGVAGGVKSTAERVTTAIGNAMIIGIFFAVTSWTSDWAVGAVAALTTVVVVVSIALGVGLADLRRVNRTGGTAAQVHPA